jgi:hypothetical protein
MINRRYFSVSFALFLATSVTFAQKTDSSKMSYERRQAALNVFIAKKKFVEKGLYSGATNETDRLLFETRVNQLAVKLLKLPQSETTKAAVLGLFRLTMSEFELADTEDREHFLEYLEELMEIFEIESSDGLLNTWRYGIDPNEPQEVRNAKAIEVMTPAEKVLLDRIGAITPTNAVEKLLSLLGPPTTQSTGVRIWLLKPDFSSVISIGNQSGATVFARLAKDRFTYSRRL